MPTAYSYVRFSSEKQKKGDSVRRQEDLATRFIVDHPELDLDLDTTLNMQDLGVSAFKGKNMRDGALGKFIQLVYTEKIDQGSYLLIENLDRFSRDEAWKAVNDLTTLIRAGINVVTLSDNHVYSEETMAGSDGTMKLMQSVLFFTRAHEESKTKSLRVKAAWANKFNMVAEGKQLTKRVPFWINPEDKNKLLEDRVPTIKRIFNMSSNGIGAHAIAKQLNADSVPSPTGRAKFWSSGSIKKMLKNPNVVGTLTTADGGEHKNYFPRVVSDSVFKKAQTYSRTSKTARGADNRSKHPLAGVVWCARCGSTAHLVTKHGRMKKDGTKTQWQYLVCSQSVSSNEGCKYQAIQNWIVIRGVISAIESYRYVDSNDAALTEKRELEERLRSLDAILDFGLITDTPLARQRYTDTLKQAGEISLRIKELDANRRPLNRKLFETTQEELLEGDEVNNAQVRMLVLRCEIDFSNGCIKVNFVNGGDKIIRL